MTGADTIRAVAMALAGVRAIDHFGRPAFRTKKRIFAVIRPDGLWLHLPPERKEFLFAADPKAFVKYMWGKTPEILVQTERIPAEALTALITEAWQAATPPPSQKRVSSRSNR